MDMRLGCLNLIHPDMSSDLMKTPEYYLRLHDEFTWRGDTLSRDKFNAVCARHGNHILKMAMPTKLGFFISELINYYLSKIGSTPWLSDLGVELNTHPYEVDTVQLALIKRIYNDHICKTIPLKFVNLSVQDMSPALISDNYVALFMYNPTTWLDTHVNEIKKRVLQDVGLFTPELWHGDIPTQELLAKAQTDGLADPATFTAKLMDTFLSFRYLPPAYFCASIPWNKKEYLGVSIPDVK